MAPAAVARRRSLGLRPRRAAVARPRRHSCVLHKSNSSAAARMYALSSLVIYPPVKLQSRC
jgi:hypothetical protein